ncbi:MAG: cell envelope integrity protein CreD [Gammaproteobacteria bacterium]
MPRWLDNKFVMPALVACAILIPLDMIQGLVGERQERHRQAVQEMAATSTGPQWLMGPVLVVPCTETYLVEERDEQTRQVRQTERTRDCTRFALPDRLDLNGTLATDERSRGIHSALFYDADLALQARFTVPGGFGSGARDARIALGSARIGIGIRDPRGVLNVPELLLDGRPLRVAPGSGLPVLGPGIHADLGPVRPDQAMEVSLPLRLRGLERLDVVPLGRLTQFRLESAWPHPSFVGRFLPASRQVSERGFEAQWSTSHFATGLQETFAGHFLDDAPAEEITAVSLGVNLIDPVDLYTQTDRAMKYGFLFVALTFIALLGTELARGLRLHAMQYAMVGVALAMFFLLLLSLAEHIGFARAYLCAACACVALLGYYLRHGLQSVGAGAGYGASLAVLYALLFALLRSEDYALVAGSVFVFGVLAALMVATRRLDWHALGAAARAPLRAGAPAAGE